MITKGKWKVEPPANEGIGARIIIDGNGSVVATVNAEANAQLISASPALYEALKNLVDIFNSDRSVTYLDCDKAEKALAKAEK